jgi:hypothetical protein
LTLSYFSGRYHLRTARIDRRFSLRVRQLGVLPRLAATFHRVRFSPRELDQRSRFCWMDGPGTRPCEAINYLRESVRTYCRDSVTPRHCYITVTFPMLGSSRSRIRALQGHLLFAES